MENTIKIDARGLSCPQPVLMVNEALKKNAECYEILIDNHTAEQNVIRCVKRAGKNVSVSNVGEDILLIVK